MARISQKLSPVTVNVPIVSEWQSYTPSSTGLGTIATPACFWRRNGQNCEVIFRFTSGTHTSSIATIDLPPGINISTTLLGNNTIVGSFSAHKTPFSGNIIFFSSFLPNRVAIVSGSSDFSAGTAGTAWASTTVFGGFFSIPVDTWVTHGPVSTVAYALTQGGNSLGSPIIIGANDGQPTYIKAGPGTAIPAGYIGEVIESQLTTGVTGSTTVNSLTYATFITLTPGRWLIEAGGSVAVTGATGTANVGVLSSVAITDYLGGIIRNEISTLSNSVLPITNTNVQVKNVEDFATGLPSTSYRRELRFGVFANSGSPTVTNVSLAGFTTRPIYIRAIRIG